MRTHAGHHGHVVALCDYCVNTVEFFGLYQAEEKMKSQGWTVRHGNVRCPTCTEIERKGLARAVRHAFRR